MVEIFIENPNILDTHKLGIELVDVAEVFVELPENPRYYISNYGRLWSDKRKKILKSIQIGSNRDEKQMRWGYQLPDLITKHPKNHRRANLVAKVFCLNVYPNNTKRVDIHHLDNNHENDVATNLAWRTPSDHVMAHKTKRIFGYDRDGELQEFNNIQALADFLGTTKHYIIRSIKTRNIICTLNDVNIVEVKGIKNYDGKSVFIGFNKVYLEHIDDDSDVLPIIGAIAGSVFILTVLKTLKNNKGKT